MKQTFLLLATMALALALSTGVALAATISAAPLALDSGPSPFTPGCNGAPQTGTNYPNAEVEPQVDVNPINPDNIVGGWQQDRWSNGGANSLVAGVTHDGGQSWKQVVIPHITRCAGGNVANGGDYERASDPWVSFAPNGDLYFISLTLNGSNDTSAVLVSKSTDGGDTWSGPETLIRETSSLTFNDKESITADPKNANNVYAVWDHLWRRSRKLGENASFKALHSAAFRQEGNVILPHSDIIFSRTTDAGAHWSTPRDILGLNKNEIMIGNQIAVLPNGNLVDIFARLSSRGAHYAAVIISKDKGGTWSSPINISTDQSVPVVDPETGAAVRAGDGLPDIAVNRTTGSLYAVWADGRFSSGARDGIAFSKSTDGGRTWSAPVQINQVPSVAAFTASVHVADDGTIGVSYYDFRNNTSAPNTLPTEYWLVHSHDGGATWNETHVAGPFDMKTAPVARGFFVGDYEGLSAVGNSFLPFFVQANSGNTNNPTDVFSTRVGP